MADDIDLLKEDGIKEMNDAHEEYYNNKEQEDNKDQEVRKEKPKKTVYDYIRIGLLVTTYLIYLFTDLLKPASLLIAFSIILFVVATFLLRPIQKFITEGENCSLPFRALFFTQIMLFLFFTGSIFVIFLTSIPDLYYAYWIALISFLLISTLEIIGAGLEDHRTRRSHSMPSRIFRNLLNIACFIIWINFMGFMLTISFPKEKGILMVEQLDPPSEIILYRNEYNGSERQYYSSDFRFVLKDQVLINQLFDELENKVYYPMDIISELNYLRMERMSGFYYRLSFQYNKNNLANIFSSENATITVINDKIVFENHRKNSAKWFFQNAIFDYYYVTLSEETMDILDSYVNNQWK